MQILFFLSQLWNYASKDWLCLSDQRHSKYLLTEGQINVLEETQNPSSNEAGVLMLDIINGLFPPKLYLIIGGGGKGYACAMVHDWRSVELGLLAWWQPNKLSNLPGLVFLNYLVVSHNNCLLFYQSNIYMCV